MNIHTQNEFDQALDAGRKLLLNAFSNWTGADFFLQFSHGFDLGGLFDGNVQTLPLSEFPLMPEHGTPDGCTPVLMYGTSNGIPLLVSLGHRHLFEGHGVLPCIFPTCIAWKLGVTRQLYFDPVLSLRHELKLGTWTLLTDFINGHHQSPLDGLLHLMEDPFTDMSFALSQELNSELVNAFSQISIEPRLCIYEAHSGAHFCTPAEAAAARAAEADIIGHDLVMEIITAHALGCKVSACGLVVGPAPDHHAPSRVTRRQMLDNCRDASPELIRGLRIALPEILATPPDYGPSQLPLTDVEEWLFQHTQFKSGKEPKLKKFLKKRDDDLQSEN